MSRSRLQIRLHRGVRRPTPPRAREDGGGYDVAVSPGFLQHLVGSVLDSLPAVLVGQGERTVWVAGLRRSPVGIDCSVRIAEFTQEVAEVQPCIIDPEFRSGSVSIRCLADTMQGRQRVAEVEPGVPGTHVCRLAEARHGIVVTVCIGQFRAKFEQRGKVLFPCGRRLALQRSVHTVNGDTRRRQVRVTVTFAQRLVRTLGSR